MKRAGFSIIIVVSVAFIGCSPQTPTGSGAFRVGYSQGCVTGYSDAYRPSYAEVSSVVQKNAERYERDVDYRNGWDTGYKACYEQEYRSPTMAG